MVAHCENGGRAAIGRSYFVWSRLWSLEISSKLKYPSARLHQTSLRQNKGAKVSYPTPKNISKCFFHVVSKKNKG